MHSTDITPAFVEGHLSKPLKHELIAIAQRATLRKAAGARNSTYTLLRDMGLVVAVSGNSRITYELTELGAGVVEIVAASGFSGKSFPLDDDKARAVEHVQGRGQLQPGQPTPQWVNAWTQRQAKDDKQADFVQAVAGLIHDYDFSEQVDVARLLERARSQAARQQRRARQDTYKAKLDAWKAEHNALSPSEYREKYGLSAAEMKNAHRILPRVDKRTKPPAPGGRSSSYEVWLVDAPPSAEHRAKIRQQTTLSKRQACEHLDVSGRIFDKLKKQLDVRHVKTVRTSSGHAAYLYSLADIDRMSDALDAGN